jgi:hypothetical protein
MTFLEKAIKENAANLNSAPWTRPSGDWSGKE